MTLLVRKYRQVTQVYLDDKMIYTTTNTVKAEAKKLRILMEAMTLMNVNVLED